MRATLKVTKPEAIEFTLTVTMSLKDWVEFSEQLPDEWPAFDFKSRVTDMVIQARKEFWPVVKVD